MYILRSNYSNNSLALIQWAHEQGLDDVRVVYTDTGWAAAGWLDFVAECEAWVERLGFAAVHLQALTPFDEVMEMKGGFPSRQHQWCALHLKGIPFLKWIEEADPDGAATVLLAKTVVDTNYQDIPEFIESCEYNGERRVWQPLYACDRAQRDALLQRAGRESLPGPSQECAPCINASAAQLRRLQAADIDKTAELEEELQTPLFPPQDCDGATGIRAVVAWAATADDQRPHYRFGCSAMFGCGC